MILVVHGATKNVGDHLIMRRGVALLRHLRPDQELVLVHRMDPHAADALARADAAVLCGGPGLGERFFPKTFPPLRALEVSDTPVLPLALGWSGRPVDHPERFSFDEPSRGMLAKIHDRIGWSSVRDDVSLGIVEGARVGEVRRTGCNAWYHLPSLGRAPDLPADVRRLVVTTPARWESHTRETLGLLRAMRARYPRAERYCVFHRGLRPGNGTRRREAAYLRATAAYARLLGFRVVDAGWDLSKIDFYGECDLHVGYRVHAHLAFVSRRRPSLLLCEDGRGVGQLVTLHDPYLLRAGDPDVLGKLEAALDAEERDGHPALHAAVDEIERTWPTMRATVEQLPG